LSLAPTRFLVTGAAGMLASELTAALADADVRGVTRDDLDLFDETAVTDAVAAADVVVNCAAYTAVDLAESEEEQATLVNARIPEVLGRAAARTGALLVQISTDYVFDGTAAEPYPESSPLSPVSACGRSKAEGERRALAAHPHGTHIVRTAWLYGRHGDNFPRTMLRLAAERDTLTVVSDQHGQPTFANDVAMQIRRIVESERPFGTWHATNAGEATWFEFARELFAVVGLDPERIQPMPGAALDRPAPRPAYGVLGHGGWAAAGIAAPRDWRSALRDAVAAGTFDDVLPRRG
jgi:dTDP-4-dehydrorhamnose reductase